MICQDARQRLSGFIRMNGGYLYIQRNLGIRNHSGSDIQNARRYRKEVGYKVSDNSIGFMAFYFCERLKEIQFPERWKRIKMHAIV